MLREAHTPWRVRSRTDTGATPSFSLLPLGDSITDGGSRVRSYRYHLHRLLVAAGYEVEWLGSMVGVHDRNDGANATAGVPLLDARDWPVEKQRHEGHWGWTAQQVLQGHTRQPQRGQLSRWLHPGHGRAIAPSVVTLHLGTNDLTKHVLKKGPKGQTATTATVARHVRGVLRRLCRVSPTVLVLLASLIPYCRFPAGDTAGPALRRATEREYNARLAELCTQRIPGCARAQITCVNMSAAVRCSQLADGVHPSAPGASAMAAAWFSALQPRLPHLRMQGVGSARLPRPRRSRGPALRLKGRPT